MAIKNRNNFLRDVVRFLFLEIFKNRLEVHFSKYNRDTMVLRQAPGVLLTPCSTRGTIDYGLARAFLLKLTRSEQRVKPGLAGDHTSASTLGFCRKNHVQSAGLWVGSLEHTAMWERERCELAWLAEM